jgi:putative heme-binding domain-containing protein
MAQCTRCHAWNGQGRAFGPDLSGLQRKYSRAQLLDQILNPSTIVAPEFQTFTATLTDDTERVGFILRREDQGIVLRDESLAEHHLPRSELKELRASTLSAMPEALLAPLTAQEAADLLEFLLQP